MKRNLDTDLTRGDALYGTDLQEHLDTPKKEKVETWIDKIFDHLTATADAHYQRTDSRDMITKTITPAGNNNKNRTYTVRVTSKIHTSVVGLITKKEIIVVTIFRSTTTLASLEREDHLDATDLMFSGQFEIIVDDGENIHSFDSHVKPIGMFHGNQFGPQRGLIIAEMILLLSTELISIENVLNKLWRTNV